MADHRKVEHQKRSLGERADINSSVVEGRTRRKVRTLEDEGPLALSGAPEIPGYNLYWALDGDPSKPNNVYNKTHQNDWEHVTYAELGLETPETNSNSGERGKYISRSAKTAGQTFYLLKKPKKWCDEDMEAFVKHNEELSKSSAETTSRDKLTRGFTELPGELTIEQKNIVK